MREQALIPVRLAIRRMGVWRSRAEYVPNAAARGAYERKKSRAGINGLFTIMALSELRRATTRNEGDEYRGFSCD